MMRLRPGALLFVLLLVLALPEAVLAHGSKIEYAVDVTIHLRATFDTGEAMAGGQVTVYAPGDPSTPWLAGTCDEEGRFSFVPDPERPGTWDVQVRQAGHGDMVHIAVGEGVGAAGDGDLSTAQIVLMAACVAWGFAGSALFFAGRRPRTGQEVKA